MLNKILKRKINKDVLTLIYKYIWHFRMNRVFLKYRYKFEYSDENNRLIYFRQKKYGVINVLNHRNISSSCKIGYDGHIRKYKTGRLTGFDTPNCYKYTSGYTMHKFILKQMLNGRSSNRFIQ